MKTPARQVSPQTQIQMAFDDANGDKPAAIEALIGPFITDNTLHNHLLRLGAATAVGNLARSDNAKIYRGDPTADVTKPTLRLVEPEGSRPGSQSHVASRVRATAGTLALLATRLPNNIRLADATASDLDDGIARFTAQGSDMLHKAQFWRSIRTKVGNHKVSECFDDRALTALYRASQNKANAA